MKEISRGPFIPKLSFRLLKERLEQQLDNDNPGIVLQAEAILQLLDQNPKLVKGFGQEESHHEYEAVIQRILAYLFPSSLTTNEIKSAMIPFSNTVLYCSERFKNIIENSDTDIDEAFAEMYKAYDDFNFIPYAVVLNRYYNYNVDFSRPLSLKIKPRDGKERTYRVLNNADLIDIYPNENAVEITEEILAEILANAEDPAVWKKYFPKDSWTVEGFGLYNLVDTTLDNQIEEFKAHLIEPNTFESFEKIVNDIRGVFNIPDLRVGVYQLDGNSLLPGYDEQAKSMTIDEMGQTTCDTYACDYIQEMLFDKHEQVILSDTESYQERSGGNSMSSNLMANGIKSIILIPIKVEDELAFVLEIGSDQKHKLNAINALKLNKLIPYIQSYAERVKDEFENQISAIIQRECTSIHPAVQWRFEEEAIQYFQHTQQGEPATFHEVVFEDVVPLYGQIDIVGSSGARNKAIQKDLLSLLDQSKTLLTDLSADQKLPFYDQ
nr:hypothetical protein [Saprospiraceae bacterium]